MEPKRAGSSGFYLSVYIFCIFHLVDIRATSRQPYVWRFYARETYAEGHNIMTHDIGNLTCPLTGCKGRITFKISTNELKSTKGWWTQEPFICLVKDQKDNFCKTEPDTYGGCPYRSCIRHWRLGENIPLSILDPNDKDWEIGVRGKIYVNLWRKNPVGDIFIYKIREMQDPSIDTFYHIHSDIEEQEKTLVREIDHSGQRGSFSWIQLIQESAQLLNLTSPGNYSECFLCAYLNKPPLTAVPLRQLMSSVQTQDPAPFSLPDVPLFQDPTGEVPECYGLPSSCNQTLPASGYIVSPPGTFFWCNRTLYRSVNQNSPFPCYQVALAPQLALYSPGELGILFSKNRIERAVLLPLLVGLSFATAAIGAGVGGAGLAESLQSSKELRAELNRVLDASALSLVSLQRQITSLARLAQQNRRALDLITEGKGGTCLFLREECCYYINESGIVEENIDKLKTIRQELESSVSIYEDEPWWKSALFTVLGPIIIPIFILFLILTVGPSMLRVIVQQIESTVTRKATAKILSLQRHHYQRVPQSEARDELSDYNIEANANTVV